MSWNTGLGDVPNVVENGEADTAICEATQLWRAEQERRCLVPFLGGF